MASNTSYDWTACERIIWRETVSENGTVAMIGSNREMNVVRMFIAAVCWGEAVSYTHLTLPTSDLV